VPVTALRQHQIEQHEVVRLLAHEEEAVLAGRRHVDVVVMRLEAVAERLRHLLLVLDDEDAHIERV
jgi:hypothetical protein